MLIQFTVGNFRSFKDPVTLSMVAAKLSSRNSKIDENNTFKFDDSLTLLKTAAVYGANASGKSNLVNALGFMRWFIINSSKESQADDPIDFHPFRLDIKTEQAPSFFEVVFLISGVIYRYGFEVTKYRVETEWLFYSPRGREAKLFLREYDDIKISRAYKGGEPLKAMTRPNALYLSVGAQFNNEIATEVLNWFRNFGVISGLDDRAYSGYTAKMFSNNPKYRKNILELILNSDMGINDVSFEKVDNSNPMLLPEDMPQEMKEYLIKQIKDIGEVINFKTLHNKICKDGRIEKVTFDLEDESEGTQKLFHISGPIINTLLEGKILLIDEIEARMHTLLTRKIIELFQSELTNPKNAQLLFATHDTNLLSNKLFRRDQIWFVEKDENGASHLYSLAELKVRNDSIYEKDYLLGRYGAIPLIGEMKQTLLDLAEEGDHATS
ncbi:MAG: ATP-binding protein [Anaerolineaceae bacterium]|jgi:AAA15 family ATPase/GTPase|nr:ATP-binding protein [Anaerolineaceae bacterium]